jgi:Fic family protein
MIDTVELSESVYNSNAIENSTLTLSETEKILLDMKTAKNLHIREVYEARNLSKVIEYMRTKARYEPLSLNIILFLHQMLLAGIDDGFAGRLRKPGEYVRVGSHIAPPPEQVERLIESLIIEYSISDDLHSLEKVSRFHLAFEHIHPFCDGNGRIGRVITNFQLLALGLPMVIIRFRDRPQYYEAFREYDERKNTKTFDTLLALSLMESLHKRIAYLRGEEIITLSAYAKMIGESASAVANKAKRQTIRAFREKGVWKIGV